MSSGSFVSFAKKNWPVVVVFAASSIAALWFGVSAVLDLIYFNDPRHKDEALKGWMTPRYVVMSYELPRGVVADALGLSEGQGRVRLKKLAEDQGLTLQELTERVRAAADAHRQGQK